VHAHYDGVWSVGGPERSGGERSADCGRDSDKYDEFLANAHAAEMN